MFSLRHSLEASLHHQVATCQPSELACLPLQIRNDSMISSSSPSITAPMSEVSKFDLKSCRCGGEMAVNKRNKGTTEKEITSFTLTIL